MFLPAALSLLSVTTPPNPQVTQPSPTPAVTTILPADAPVVILVNTKAADCETLSRFQLFQAAYAGVKSFLPTDMQFDYAKDVDSWLGDQVALAFMPKVGRSEVTLDSNFLMIAPVKDDSRLQQLLSQIKPGKQERLTEYHYKGVTILEFKTLPPVPPPQSTPIPPQKPRPLTPVQSSRPNLPQPNPNQPGQEFAIALLPGYVVAANTVKPIKQLLDLPKGRDTLAQNPQFQRTIQRPQVGPKLLTLYENPAKFLPLLNSLTKDPRLPFPLAPNSVSLEQLKDYSTLDGFLLVQPEGLHFQFNAYRQTPRTDRANILSSEANQILARIPGTTYSAATGQNLKQQWQALVAVFNADPKLKANLNQFRSFVRTSTGLDVDRDIVDWMDGDYAYFAYPKRGISSLVSPKFNSGLGFLVQTSNRAAAEATLKRLDQFVKSFSQGSVEATSRSIKGEPVTSWEAKGGSPSKSLFAYSWIDNNTLLIATGFGAMADLVPSPYQSLPRSYTFTTATNSLPSPNEGYFYLNMGSFLSWAYGFVPPSQLNDPYFRIFKQFIGTIYSISATSSATAEGEQVDGLAVLAPVRSH